ncbi:HIV Tat-specific factor 1 homolog [Anopheles ziemanni]|uniref:HIV Tat-specific factor 1 homolog n=1 Tax=Anopheles coustani TaxID=139045 RepID=UPI002658E292|nr:HIV Tat-specific factor 1 homolog [Anopheles coustani]XP_058178339.1 HIV Tat-specific factor 1 homolog [Anopheles ziemanni]
MSDSGDSGPPSSVNVSSALAAMSSAESASSVLMLTDSENANNENRAIEMEANSSGGGEETPAATSETVESVSGSVEQSDRSEGDDSKQGEVTGEKEEKESGDVKAEVSGEPVKSGQDQYAEHVTYNAAGEAIYTDPATKYQYRWCKEKNEWTPLATATEPDGSGGTASENPYENEHYRWCHEKKEWIPKQQNATETEFYRWDAATGKWIPKEQPTPAGGNDPDRDYGYEDGVHTYRDKDGAVYFWDTERKAWFPKVDDDFMAIYQLNYGFIDNTSGPTTASAPKVVDVAPPIPPRTDDDDGSISDEQDDAQKQPKGKKRKAPPEPPKWFELAPEHNTKVYVSNLPTDVTEEEFGELMSKCGMVMKDPKTHKLKLKLYRDSDGQLKGDGLCHYIKIESVDLALKILDNYDVRGHKIKVQRAEFQMRGEYNPTLKPKMRKKEKERIKKMQESLFDWRPEKMRGERSKHERIVIIKNLFEPSLFDREVHLLLEYQSDLREECGKCGTVRRVLLYDRHPEGVAQVTMGDPEEADLVVQLMNGRYFGQRKLTAAIWDGRTKYRIAETDADVNQRRGNWEQFLETGETPDAADQDKESDSGKPNESQPSTKDAKASPEREGKKAEEDVPSSGESTPEMRSERDEQPLPVADEPVESKEKDTEGDDNEESDDDDDDDDGDDGKQDGGDDQDE